MSMHDPELQQTQIVFAVAQQYFETTADTGAHHIFSRLWPLVLEDGRRAHERDFPNNGLVWWKLRPASRKDAQPGRLFVGYIEPAVVAVLDDPAKELYQASPLDIEPLDPGDGVEIFTVPDNAVESARDLVNTPGVLHIDHPPSEAVLVRWRGELYGLLRTSIAASGGGEYRVSLKPETADGLVYRMPDIPPGTTGHLRFDDVRVALDTQPPFRSRNLVTSTYEVALARALEGLDVSRRRTVLLLRDDELITRAARRLLTRSERQQLNDLLTRLDDAAGSDAGVEEFSVAEVIASVRRRAGVDSPVIGSLADALLTSNVMARPLAEAIQRNAERHIEQNAASISAQIEERVAAERQQLERLRRELEDVDAELQARRDAAEREIRAAIDAAWSEHRANVEADLARVQAEYDRLEQSSHGLTERLTRIASTFGSEHERLLGDLLVLLPILQRAAIERGTFAGTPAAGGDAMREPSTAAASPAQSPLELPPCVRTGASDPRGAPTEARFFERFSDFVRASGHSFERDELAAFHVAVKCGDVTLLAGAPGSGRAALTHLYATALGGDHASTRWLSVPVQSTWLDLQDLIGGVNPNARLFEPAPTGIFGFLAACAEEYALHDGDSGVWLLCLAGLDRAPPDGYLSAVLHALDQPAGTRRVRCFDAHAVHPSSALARWSTIELPQSLRIVGTLSGEDTASGVPMTLRDRATELSPGLHATADYTPGGGAPIDVGPATGGSPVSVRTLERWVRIAPPGAPWAELFDRLRVLLRTRRVDLTPRALHAMYRFIASAPPVLNTSDAVDLQIAQRILARVSGAAPGDEGVIEQVATIIGSHADTLPLSMNALQQLREDLA